MLTGQPPLLPETGRPGILNTVSQNLHIFQVSALLARACKIVALLQ